MDPVQTSNPQDNQQGQGVPFGGQTPQPPVPPISMVDPLDTQGGMPPFHFDESEFVIAPSTPAPTMSDNTVPFGGVAMPVPVAPVTPAETTSTTSETSPEQSTSPFAPRPDLDDEVAPTPVSIETQSGNEPFATATGFDLPSFDTTSTTNETKNEVGPFAMPTAETKVIPTAESQTSEASPSFELPSFDTTPVAPADNTNDTSFDLPSFEMTAPTTATTENTTTQIPEVVVPSFEMPSDEINTADVSIPATPSFDLPAVTEAIVDENPVTSSSTSDMTTEKEETPTTPTPIETTNTESVMSVDTESETVPVMQPDTEDTTPPASYTEDNTSPIAESYNSFVEKLTQLLDMTKTETVSLVGHHTDDEHINYEFSHDETESVIIKHHDLTAEQSSATHTLSIDHSDGLSVYLDDELLADYSDTSVVVDEQISYYINDKLQKFSLMLDAEYERLNKKSKEDQEKKKKLLADLRAF